MKLFFDPETYKLIDITAPTPTELNYHYSDSQEHYDKFEKIACKISPEQLDIGIVPKDIFFPETFEKLFFEVPCKDDFLSGYSHGQTDGYIHGQRIYMSKVRQVSWSFLIGYEYGVLIGRYLSNEKMAD